VLLSIAGQFKSVRVLLVLISSVCSMLLQGYGQENPTPANKQPEVRVNYLNVCAPSDSDKQEFLTSLNKIPAPKFASDFEISRGRSSLQDAPTANWVRVRREFPTGAPVVAAQYSLTVDEKSMIETLVFRSREAKDVMQVQLEVTVTGAQNPASVLAADTPVNRIKLERFGKASSVLARCTNGDQSAYEPLFRKASSVLAEYRTAMGIKRLVPRELAMLGPITPASGPKKAAKK
jgi:hypothetical protein